MSHSRVAVRLRFAEDLPPSHGVHMVIPDRSASWVVDSVADGYQVLLRPLPVGEHLVEITIPAPQGEVPTVVSYRLRVESGAYADATASPVASPSS